MNTVVKAYDLDIGKLNVDALSFRKYKHLYSITLPNRLMSIGDAAFAFCKS